MVWARAVCSEVKIGRPPGGHVRSPGGANEPESETTPIS